MLLLLKNLMVAPALRHDLHVSLVLWCCVRILQKLDVEY
jgi:hypothetical protein